MCFCIYIYFWIRVALLIYNIICSLLSSHFLTGLWFLHRIPRFVRQYISYILFFAGIARVKASIGCLRPSSACIACALWHQEREWNVRSGIKRKNFARVYAKLLWRMIYCSNLRPRNDSQSGYLSQRRIGRRYPWIIWDYNITTAIAIQPLTQPWTFKMSYSIFSAMSRLKSASMNRDTFPSIPSTEIKMEKTFSVACGNYYWVFPPFLYPTKPRAFPLAPSCGIQSLVPPVWRQLFPQSDFPISPGLGRH